MDKMTLKKHIKAQGRTISWVAEQIDQSQPYLSMKLNGSGEARLDNDTIVKVCDIISVDVENVTDYNKKEL